MSYINERFEVNHQTRMLLQSITPNFGYPESGFGEYIYYRHYSRLMGSAQEHWPDTVERVINGVMSIRKDWYIRNVIRWDEAYWQVYAKRMALSMFRMEWLPPGRGLWAMGTDVVRERGAMPLYNCSYTEIGQNWIDDLCWLMDGLMNGVGVGFGPLRNNLQLKDFKSQVQFTIPDTKEGWVESICLLLSSFIGGSHPIFDYSLIRPKGSLIKTFGGIASGPKPLMNLHENVYDACIKYQSGSTDEIQFKTDIANMIGVCVISGNVRRSAEIGIGDINDPIFMHLKDYERFPEREAWGWMSNNSVRLVESEDFEHLDMIAYQSARGRDLGFLNMRNIKHGRIGKFKDGAKEDAAVGINPCIPSWSFLLTPTGLRRLDQISVGDKIWSETGWTNIVNKQCTGTKDVYRYHTRSGSFYGTKNHNVSSDCFKIEVQYADVIDCLQGPQVRSEKGRTTEELQAIVDGLVIGDGSYQGRILLNIGENDQDYFQSEIYTWIHESYNKGTQYKIDSSMTEEEFKRKIIPLRYVCAKPNVVAAFLRGLFSANGSVVRNRIQLKTASKQIREAVQLMLSSIGIQSYYTTNKEHEVEFRNGIYMCQESYDVTISCDRGLFVASIGFLQEYKNEKIKTVTQTKLKSTYEVVSTDYVSTEPVYSITVDNSTHTYWFHGLNVFNCGEIPLEHREVCNLAETLPTRCVDYMRWLDACEFATFYCSTVALLPTHQPTTNAVVARNRRIGVSLIDFTGWKHEIGVRKVIKYLRLGYQRIRRTNEELAHEAGVPTSIRVTTVKPGGTVPKLAGRVSGVGHPTHSYTERRVNVGKDSPIEKVLMEANVKYEPSAVTPETTNVFSFPILQGPAEPATEISIWEQALNLVLMQREWADNAVSNTLYFKPAWILIAEGNLNFDDNYDARIAYKDATGRGRYRESLKETYKFRFDTETDDWKLYQFNPNHEEGDLEAVLAHIAPYVKSVSLLPHTLKGIWAQMPEEGITSDEYYDMLSHMKAIDWSKYFGGDGLDEKFCTGDVCDANLG